MTYANCCAARAMGSRSTADMPSTCDCVRHFRTASCRTDCWTAPSLCRIWVRPSPTADGVPNSPAQQMKGNNIDQSCRDEHLQMMGHNFAYILSGHLSIVLRVKLECVENGHKRWVPHCGQKCFGIFEIRWELLQQLPNTIQKQQ